LVAEGIWVVVAAGLAVAIPGIGSAMGVGMTGVASAGVASEDPKKAYKAFVFTVVPGTQGIYGFIAAFLIMVGTGLSAGAGVKEGIVGTAVLAAAIPAILQGLTSYYQGKVATAGVSALAKRPETFAPCIMYTVMVELYAILGLLATILLLTFIGAL
jgi:V/A-type H+-transporting ATPase subunit K